MFFQQIPWKLNDNSLYLYAFYQMQIIKLNCYLLACFFSAGSKRNHGRETKQAEVYVK